MEKSLDDPAYEPRTYLMNEVLPGETYELVISVLKGGAFMRYRVGDVYRCMGLENSGDGTKIPRFAYIDRVPTIIDIASFTRISEATIQSVITLSGLKFRGWVAMKEYNEQKRPYMHLYVELEPDALISTAVTKEVLREHLEIYFKYMDNDYKDLKRLLGMEPLEITILKCGSFEAYQKKTGKTLRHVGPSAHDLKDLIG